MQPAQPRDGVAESALEGPQVPDETVNCVNKALLDCRGCRLQRDRRGNFAVAPLTHHRSHL